MSEQLLSDVEAQLQASVRSFVEKEIVPHAQSWDRSGRYPLELFTKFGELGWLGTAFPEYVGGSGGG
jgi:alkylation response protein AidB-like acyl-CoA dehydrogenase